MSLLTKLKTERLYFDGGYGTLLQAEGLAPGEAPEQWNISHPDVIERLHYEYLSAGCDLLKTNTFGANILKYNHDELETIIREAISCAKRAAEKISDKKYIGLDIGPTGKLLKPMGDLEFEDAVSVFAETVKLGVKHGVDFILIETMNDSYETKAAVLAAKENSSLPVFVTNAYDESGKLMTGASPEAMVSMLEGLRVDALGVNCSFGPEKMLPVVKKLLEHASVPVIVNPNAGMPRVENGKTSYDLSPDAFSDIMIQIANEGASVLGGCCGTTPAYIKALTQKTKDILKTPVIPKENVVISSYSHTVLFDQTPVLIGERINPTGKPLLKAALRENNLDYILKEGITQQELGAHVLDVNVGLPEIDETVVLPDTITALQSVTDLPLQIDTSNPTAMEKALRLYNGKALINSVNGKKESMNEIFPLAAKYGGVLIALTLDENGIPETAEERVAIALKIIEEAKRYGISKKDIIVDPLALTISSLPEAALITLKSIQMLSELGIKTSLGVSNVSFGLPERGTINANFFTMAMQQGLSAAIINPNAKEMMDAYFAFCALSGLDMQCQKYIEYKTKEGSEKKGSSPAKSHKEVSENGLQDAIIKGLKEEVAVQVKALLEKKEALSIIDTCIIPALDTVGARFEAKKAFLPQLLMSAESAKVAFDILKETLSKSGEERPKKAKFVLATVKGDIHDIGKNIVKVLLENYDFDVIDLGKDVAPEQIAESVLNEKAPLLGLSALMTTTVPAMEETILLVQKTSPGTKIVVGGAVLTEDYAQKIGADHYAKDAMEAVKYADFIAKN